MTDEQALKIIAVLTSAFPNANVTEETVEIYIHFLKPYQYELIKQATFRLIKTSQFFPTIAEITNAVEKFNPDQLPEADQAWGEVMRQLSEVGHCGIPQFTHESIREAVKTIGWMNLCRSETIGIERAHFTKIYGAIRNRRQDQKINNQVLKLVGGIGLLGDGK